MQGAGEVFCVDDGGDVFGFGGGLEAHQHLFFDVIAEAIGVGERGLACDHGIEHCLVDFFRELVVFHAQRDELLVGFFVGVVHCHHLVEAAQDGWVEGVADVGCADDHGVVFVPIEGAQEGIGGARDFLAGALVVV